MSSHDCVTDHSSLSWQLVVEKKRAPWMVAPVRLAPVKFANSKVVPLSRSRMDERTNNPFAARMWHDQPCRSRTLPPRRRPAPNKAQAPNAPIPSSTKLAGSGTTCGEAGVAALAN